jgi:predicted transposase/invertase (TIGR01784 family)
MILKPLADPTFKKVFGECDDLLINLINALLELPDAVVAIEYLPNELLAKKSSGKNTVVDVRCTDRAGRHFIVEMQIDHHAYFLERLLFNAAKVYASQLEQGDPYVKIQPVYAISILDDILVKTNEHCVQTYSVINHHDINERANGLHIVVLELSKCRIMRNLDMGNPLDRWIQYFINPEYYLSMEKQELEKMPYQRKAVEILDTSNFTPGQMRAYDQYIDSVRLHNTIMEDAWERGIREGQAKGVSEGMEKGIEKGKADGMHMSVLIIEELKSGIKPADIAEKHQVNPALVEQLKALI